MSYSPYPGEASAFSAKTSEITEKLTQTEVGLREANSIFKIDENEDYLTLKTLESTEELLNTISAGKTLLSTESSLVTKKANELEEEAKQIATANLEEEGASSERN